MDSQILTNLSLLMGTLGSIPTAVFLFNRLFFGPKLIIETAVSPKESGLGETLVVYCTSKKEIIITDVLIYYNPFLCNVETGGPIYGSLYGTRKAGFKELVPHRIPWLCYRTDLPLNLFLSITPTPDSTSEEIIIEISIEAHLPENSLPILVNMFPPKNKVFYVVHRIPKGGNNIGKAAG